jgi:hypothetical protein
MKILINSLTFARSNRLFQNKVLSKQITIKPSSRNYINGKRRDINIKIENEPIPYALNQREKVSLIFKATLFTVGVSFE